MNPDASTAEPPYQPPTVERLGTLAELTQGGTTGLDDGTGGAGDSSLI